MPLRDFGSSVNDCLPGFSPMKSLLLLMTICPPDVLLGVSRIPMGRKYSAYLCPGGRLTVPPRDQGPSPSSSMMSNCKETTPSFLASRSREHLYIVLVGTCDAGWGGASENRDNIFSATGASRSSV